MIRKHIDYSRMKDYSIPLQEPEQLIYIDYEPDHCIFIPRNEKDKKFNVTHVMEDVYEDGEYVCTNFSGVYPGEPSRKKGIFMYQMKYNLKVEEIMENED